VDVLFFGGLNPQREAIIADVNATGVSVHVLAGGTMKFGEDLDKVLARTKIVLNLHYYHGVMVRHPAPDRLLAIIRVLCSFCSSHCVLAACPDCCGRQLHAHNEVGLFSRSCQLYLLVLSSPQLVVRALHQCIQVSLAP